MGSCMHVHRVGAHLNTLVAPFVTMSPRQHPLLSRRPLDLRARGFTHDGAASLFAAHCVDTRAVSTFTLGLPGWFQLRISAVDLNAARARRGAWSMSSLHFTALPIEDQRFSCASGGMSSFITCRRRRLRPYMRSMARCWASALAQRALRPTLKRQNHESGGPRSGPSMTPA